MTSKAAFKEAQRRWGNGAVVRDGYKRSAGTPESRLAARQALAELRGFVTRETRREFKPLMDKLFHDATAMRYSVGELNDAGPFAFISIRGQGDTWEEAFAAAGNR